MQNILAVVSLVLFMCIFISSTAGSSFLGHFFLLGLVKFEASSLLFAVAAGLMVLMLYNDNLSQRVSFAWSYHLILIFAGILFVYSAEDDRYLDTLVQPTFIVSASIYLMSTSLLLISLNRTKIS